MKPVPILTADEMRAAEEAAIEAGTPVETLMERAGRAAANAVMLYCGPLPALVLCGPGNNGGDGYVIARALAERGVKVRVAASGEPMSDAAKAARRSWGGEVEDLATAAPAPLLIDALFGTGLRRPLGADLAGRLCELASAARVCVAVDLPSGAASDDGALMSPIPNFDLTITFATLKPSHLLHPAAAHMGRIVIADIGLVAESLLVQIARPCLPAPGPDDHKYSRGYVAILAGDMPGAAALAASAALGAGAGYVRLLAITPVTGIPSAVVQSHGDPAEYLADSRIGALLFGPGLGRDAAARTLMDRALGSRLPLVIDGDALTLIAERGVETISGLAGTAILTPHHGEFERLFPDLEGSKVDRARAAAARSGAIIVYKGADTVVAAPDGRAAIAAPASPWLATAGTGDVLAGIVAALRARGLDPFDAACAGVWLHARAAELAGEGLIADDLPGLLPTALATCQ